ncbi:MAG: hypothetical protein DWQ08_03255 [Proteobacteria bacterium]|nr:MAG: hypothetical protein DWQ08_03255 [Pseudomonadota bacterium]
MQRRLDIRLGAVNRGSKSFRHERAANWRTRIVDRTTPRDLHEPGALHSTWRDRVVAASDLYRDEHDGRYVIREDLMPRIKGLPPPLRQRLVRKMKRLLENLS